MELEKTTAVYGHVFRLNVAVENGTDWTGKGKAYKHFCLIDLGEDFEQAKVKAMTIKIAMGELYKFTLKAEPKVAHYSEEI